MIFLIPSGAIVALTLAYLIGKSLHLSVGNAPRVAVFIQVDNPKNVVVAMPWFNKIGNAFPGGPGPVGSADDDTI